MLSLIKFELKKMLTRRVAVAANAGAIVMLVAVMALNVMQARAEGNIGEILSGPEAIAHRREVAEARAGELTPERMAADIARYQEIAYERLNPEELADMSDAAAYEAVAEAYDEATRLELYDPYYITLLKPWAVRGLEPYQYAFRVTPEMALDFYGALAASLQDSLDEGMGGEWVYSPAERAFWTEKEAGVAEPIGYGWSGGWDNILDCTAFLVFAIFAACVTVTPLFASEYREGTDAVLLSSLNGRGRLVAAKLAAAALYATALFAAGAAIVCGVSLAFYGAGGADLTIQNYALASPYNLTMAQAAALYIGIFYLVMLGMLALTLALSASTPSTLAIIVTDVVVLFVTGLLPSAGVGVLRHILTLFPMGLQSPFDMFAALFSYPVGPVVLDLIGMAALVYGALVAVGVPLALGRWCRLKVDCSAQGHPSAAFRAPRRRMWGGGRLRFGGFAPIPCDLRRIPAPGGRTGCTRVRRRPSRPAVRPLLPNRRCRGARHVLDSAKSSSRGQGGSGEDVSPKKWREGIGPWVTCRLRSPRLEARSDGIRRLQARDAVAALPGSVRSLRLAPRAKKGLHRCRLPEPRRGEEELHRKERRPVPEGPEHRPDGRGGRHGGLPPLRPPRRAPDHGRGLPQG